MDLRIIGLGGVDWIRLAEDRDRWRAVVNIDESKNISDKRNSEK
jgi:hypothetical protein